MRRFRRFARRGMRPLWRQVLRARARDVTMEAAGRAALVVAPHPDDETLGCGGTIALKRRHGSRVRVLVVTDGRSSHQSTMVSPDELAAFRAAEVGRACERLGVPAGELVLLGIAEDRLAGEYGMLVNAVMAQLQTGDFDEVLVTSAWDWHDDHRLVAAAVHEAVERGDGTVPVLEYPVWSWVDGPWTNASGRSVARALADMFGEPAQALAGARIRSVDVSSVTERKRAAIAEYRSQTTNLTGEEDWAVMDAKLIGLFLGGTEILTEAVANKATGATR